MSIPQGQLSNEEADHIGPLAVLELVSVLVTRRSHIIILVLADCQSVRVSTAGMHAMHQRSFLVEYPRSREPSAPPKLYMIVSQNRGTPI